MSDLVQKVALKRTAQKKLPEFDSGDTIGVYVKIKEGGKERIQLYKGVVTKVEGRGTSRSFTVRKISSGVGVERTFPFASPSIDRIDVHSRGKVRRGRLYFLRGLKGRASKLTSSLVFNESKETASPANSETAE